MTSILPSVAVLELTYIAGADSLLLNRFLPGGRGLSHPELILTREEVCLAADIAEDVQRVR